MSMLRSCCCDQNTCNGSVERMVFFDGNLARKDVNTAGGTTFEIVAAASLWYAGGDNQALSVFPKLSPLATTPAGHFLKTQKPATITWNFFAYAFDELIVNPNSSSFPPITGPVVFRLNTGELKINGVTRSEVTNVAFVASPYTTSSTTHNVITGGRLFRPYTLTAVFPGTTIQPEDMLTIAAEFYMETNGDGIQHSSNPAYSGRTGIASARFSLSYGGGTYWLSQSLTYPTTKRGYRRMSLEITGEGSYDLYAAPTGWTQTSNTPCQVSIGKTVPQVFTAPSFSRSLNRQKRFTVDWSGEVLLLTIFQPDPGSLFYSAAVGNVAEYVYYRATSVWDGRSSVTMEPIGFKNRPSSFNGASDGGVSDATFLNLFADVPSSIVITP
jgi:hypothetical protein